MTHTEPAARTATVTHAAALALVRAERPDFAALGPDERTALVAAAADRLRAETATVTISTSSRPDTHAHAAMSVPTAGAPRTYFALLPSEAHVTGWIARATEVAGRYGMAVVIIDTRKDS